MDISSRKAERVALTGFISSIVFFVVTLVVGAACRAFAVSALSWLVLGNLLIWFVLLIYYHQCSLAEQEKLDLAQMAHEKSSETIFQSNRQQELFAVAQKRLIFIEKWFIPIIAIIIALYHLGIGAFLIRSMLLYELKEVRNPQVGGFIVIIIAFFSFLISRYATGMSAEKKWKTLRAGGSILLAVAVFSFFLAISLILAQLKFVFGLMILNWVIPSIIVLLGLESILAAVLDIYRPRVSGQYHRVAFDSRLLGIINEPGGILHTFASTMDYQFGFKVSQTWFYRLLEKAIIPLLIFGLFILYLLSCFVVVQPGEEAIIEHLGSFHQHGRHVQPGLHLKWPWPFDIAYIYPTKRIQQVNVGFVEETQDGQVVEPRHLLWGEQHFKEEYNLLVASKADGAKDEEGAVPVSLVRANVPVLYRIKNLEDYIYNHADSKQMLEAICYRELVKFSAGAKIETDFEDKEEADLDASLLGAGRSAASKYLADRIQRAADEAGLGVEIVLLGLQGVHPPPDVAEDYQNVIGSIQKRQASILNALAESNKMLTQLSGSVTQANELYELAETLQAAKEKGNTASIEQAQKDLLFSFQQAKGDIFATLSQARGYAFERATIARATGDRFNQQILSYQAMPEIYKRELRLVVLEESLMNTRKYILIADKEDSQVFILDLQEKLASGLYDMSVEDFKQSQE